MFIARSLMFYPGYFADNCKELSDEIIIPAFHLNKLIDRFQDGEPLIIQMKNVENDLKYIVAIGQPHHYDKNTVFVPQWILDILGHNGISDNLIRLEKIDTLDIPVATKIVIKPLDPLAFEFDVRELFESVLTNLHTIRSGLTIPVAVPELGKDYRIFAHIERVEPAKTCRIVNSEVEVEFINEFAESATGPAAAETLQSVPEPVVQNTVVESFNTIVTTPELGPQKSPTAMTAEQREVVRNAWLKRFQNTSEPQSQ